MSEQPKPLPCRASVGDCGQRYEIRWKDLAHQNYRVLGWATTRQKAEEMVSAWMSAPYVQSAWIFERCGEWFSAEGLTHLVCTLAEGHNGDHSTGGQGDNK